MPDESPGKYEIYENGVVMTYGHAMLRLLMDREGLIYMDLMNNSPVHRENRLIHEVTHEDYKGARILMRKRTAQVLWKMLSIMLDQKQDEPDMSIPFQLPPN